MAGEKFLDVFDDLQGHQGGLYGVEQEDFVDSYWDCARVWLKGLKETTLMDMPTALDSGPDHFPGEASGCIVYGIIFPARQEAASEKTH